MRFILYSLCLAALLMASCDNQNEQPEDTKVPETYTFERDGNSTVDYSGQITRLNMFKALSGHIKSSNNWPLDNAQLQNMYANNNAPFQDEALNTSDKNLLSKTAASSIYFSANAQEQAAIRGEFQMWLEDLAQTSTNSSETAEDGMAGVAHGYLFTAKGFEEIQFFEKSLMGALLLDQCINNYLSDQKLDGGSNREDQENGVTVEGKPYTAMEHYWDEGYGYIIGASTDAYWHKYLQTVSGKAAYSGMLQKVEDAFIAGRHAITQNDWEERDAQRDILVESLSRTCGIMAIHYLKSGQDQLVPDASKAFHALSEAYGFMYSLRFTRELSSNEPYFDEQTYKSLLSDFIGQERGFWDVDAMDGIISSSIQQIEDAYGLNASDI